MKRSISILVAIATLVGASAAYAALNTYSATVSFSPSRAGSAQKPSPIGFTTRFTAANAISGDRTVPIVDVRIKVYGVRVNSAGFPACSFTTIDTGPRYDALCPRSSLVATGSVSSELGNTVLSSPGSPCTLGVHVLNAGAGKLWDFHTATGPSCGGLKTGDVAPTPGSFSQSGKYLLIDIPVPRDSSTAVAYHTGLFASLINETVNWQQLTRRIHGRTVGFFSSVACAGGRRPWSVTYTDTDLKTRETKTISGSAHC